jgi:hypothetical protein
MKTNNSFSDYVDKALTFFIIFGICMIILYCKIFEFIIIRTSIKKNIVNENLNNETYKLTMEKSIKEDKEIEI